MVVKYKVKIAKKWTKSDGSRAGSEKKECITVNYGKILIGYLSELLNFPVKCSYIAWEDVKV